MPLQARYRQRFYLEHLVITVFALLLGATLVLSKAVAPLDHFLYDRMARWSAPTPARDLVIIAIDDISLRELGAWPWDRAQLALLVEQLKAYRSGPVILDLLLTEQDMLRPDSDRRLADALASHGQVYLPVQIGYYGIAGHPVERLPTHRFASQARALGHVELTVDEDGLVRSLYLRAGIGEPWWPHLALAVLADQAAHKAQPYASASALRRDGLAQEHLRYIPFAAGGDSYLKVSATDVIHGRVPASLLAGRTLLVGATVEGLGDMVSTPRAGQARMPGVEVNAHILDALRQERLVTRSRPGTVLALTLVLGLLVPLLMPLLTPRHALLLVLGSLVGTSMTGYLLLAVGHYWLPLGAPLLVVALVYPLWTWRRLSYTLDFLRQALSRLARYSALNRRLAEAASVTPLLRMLDRALPVVAWRLERRGSAEVQTGGEPQQERSWQLPRVSHFSFRRDRDRYELSVMWREENVAPRLHDWLQSMVNRVALPHRSRGGVYEVAEGYIEGIVEEEARQQALTRFFSASLEQLREGVVLCDACGSVLFANGQALDWLALQPSQLDGLHLLDISRALTLPLQRQDWPALVADALAEGVASVECRDRADRDLLLELSSVQVGSQPGQVMILTLKDVSEVKHALRTRTELLDFVSHDLRSPMISVLALAEKMRDSEAGQAMQGFLDQVSRYAQTSLTISEQFLQLARLESLDRVALAELDMLPVVESAIEQARSLAQQQEVKIRFLYDLDDDVWVLGNHELLERAIVNLLTSAIQSSYAGSSVDVRLWCEDSKVCCEVRDRGAGLAPEVAGQLRARDADLLSRGQARLRATGLALRFVGAVCDRHGGEAHVSSQPSEGCRITLCLPRYRPDAHPDH